MTKALYIFAFLIISNFSSFSQNSLNDYKYIIVPAQFEFQKERDQYQINSLTEFLFNKYGYTAFKQDEELPEDLRNNRCLALTADVIKLSALLKTKMQIELKDCNGNLVQTSDVGETREKEYAKAYNLAIRDAFKTFQNANYSYQPNDNIVLSKSTPSAPLVIKENVEEITRLKQEIKTLKEEQVEVVEIESPMVKTQLPEQKTATEEIKLVENGNIVGMLYAQPIENGFQIVDTTPKKVMVLHYSGVKDVFTVIGKKAIVFKKGDEWMYSESGDILKGEPINIKF